MKNPTGLSPQQLSRLNQRVERAKEALRRETDEEMAALRARVVELERRRPAPVDEIADAIAARLEDRTLPKLAAAIAAEAGRGRP